MFNVNMNRILRYLHRPFVLFDTEFTAWKGSHLTNWQDHRQPRHLIQVGVIKCSPFPRSEIISERNYLIVPNPTHIKKLNLKDLPEPKLISSYFENLTGISKQEIDRHGIGLDQFYQEFYQFIGSSSHGFSYGPDNEILGENLNYLGDKLISSEIPIWMLTNLHDVRDIFVYSHRCDVVRKYNSGNLYQAFNLTPTLSDLREHNAIWDVKSLYASISAFYHELN